MSEKLRVIIAASGTGGHLFPAVYIAEAFKKQKQDIELHFIGSGRPLEERILSNKGFGVFTIPTYGVKNLGLVGSLRFLLTAPVSFIKTVSIFRKVRPQVVIGVGGYVTVIPIITARLFGIPTWVHEAELKPGLANKVLKNFANKISTAFREAELGKHKNATYTGHPVRQDLRQVTPGLALGQEPRSILILGGSQGANSLDDTMPKVLSQYKNLNLEIRHQCREPNVDKVKADYKTAGLNAKIESFIDNMAEAYSWADIIVARSGAGTVMEIGVVNRPTIFVPFPFAQGDHQTANAMTLVKAGKALIAKEGTDFEKQLNHALNKILEPNFYFAMKLAKYDSRSLDAADKIVQGCMKLIEKKT